MSWECLDSPTDGGSALVGKRVTGRTATGDECGRLAAESMSGLWYSVRSAMVWSC